MADAVDIHIEKFDTASLRATSGPLVMEIGRVIMSKVVGRLRMGAGEPRLSALEAASAEVSGVKVYGPLALAQQSTGDAAGAWSFGPLASADGAIRAQIVDAHMLFDADVTIPIRQGVIDFDDASVEHVGPDSRMGVSRMGLYVDAPNGRNYVYQFSSAPVGGVEYEERGALLGTRVSDRGKLHLQGFLESLLRQPWTGQSLGLTAQARQMFDRTALSGEVLLGDGTFAAPGVQAELVGRAEGRNAVRVHSEAVDRGLDAEIALLSVRNAVLKLGSMQLACDEITAALLLRVFIDGGTLRFTVNLEDIKMSGVILQHA